jgi:hypothetical protein
LSQRKGARQRNNSPVIKHSENPTPKHDSWWDTQLIPEPEGQHTNINCHSPLREELTKQLPLKDRRKKQTISNQLARLRQSFCLNTNTRIGC